MTGKNLLAKLMASVGVSAAATAVAAGVPGLTDEQTSAGTTELEGLVEAAHLEGVNEGRRMERERFGAVLTDEAADGRMGLAITQLSTTDNTAEQIVTCLNASPKAAAPVAAEPAKPAATDTKQHKADDPLKGKTGADAIAEATPLVDTGAPGQNAEDQDTVNVDAIWGPALDTAAANRGITSDFSANGLGRRAA
jgi:hypothetical protein